MSLYEIIMVTCVVLLAAVVAAIHYEPFVTWFSKTFRHDSDMDNWSNK